MPSWKGYQHKTSKEAYLSEINVGYLPAIRDTPTKYDVIFQILRRSLECKDHLNLDFIVLEVDQAIYIKVLQLKFQLHKDNSLKYDNVVVRMGGFHILLCLVRSIYS